MEQQAFVDDIEYLTPEDNKRVVRVRLARPIKSISTKVRRVMFKREKSQMENMNALLTTLSESRDKSVFAELFEYFAPRLKSMLIGTGTDPQTAEELAQEAMLSVWRKSHLYDPSKSAASTWIFTIARNLRIDRFRSEKRPEYDPNDPALIPAAEPLADEHVHVSERQALVRVALSKLPHEQREVVSLSFVEGLSHQEIADRLNLPLGTVKSRLRLSFSKLKSSLRSQI